MFNCLQDYLRELGDQLEEDRALGKLPPSLRGVGHLLDATEEVYTGAISAAASIINATFAISHSSEVCSYLYSAGT